MSSNTSAIGIIFSSPSTSPSFPVPTSSGDSLVLSSSTPLPSNSGLASPPASITAFPATSSSFAFLSTLSFSGSLTILVSPSSTTDSDPQSEPVNSPLPPNIASSTLDFSSILPLFSFTVIIPLPSVTSLSTASSIFPNQSLPSPSTMATTPTVTSTLTDSSVSVTETETTTTSTDTLPTSPPTSVSSNDGPSTTSESSATSVPLVTSTTESTSESTSSSTTSSSTRSPRPSTSSTLTSSSSLNFSISKVAAPSTTSTDDRTANSSSLSSPTPTTTLIVQPPAIPAPSSITSSAPSSPPATTSNVTAANNSGGNGSSNSTMNISGAATNSHKKTAVIAGLTTGMLLLFLLLASITFCRWRSRRKHSARHDAIRRASADWIRQNHGPSAAASTSSLIPRVTHSMIWDNSPPEKDPIADPATNTQSLEDAMSPYTTNAPAVAPDAVADNPGQWMEPSSWQSTLLSAARTPLPPYAQTSDSNVIQYNVRQNPEPYYYEQIQQNPYQGPLVPNRAMPTPSPSPPLVVPAINVTIPESNRRISRETLPIPLVTPVSDYTPWNPFRSSLRSSLNSATSSASKYSVPSMTEVPPVPRIPSSYFGIGNAGPGPSTLQNRALIFTNKGPVVRFAPPTPTTPTAHMSLVPQAAERGGDNIDMFLDLQPKTARLSSVNTDREMFGSPNESYRSSQSHSRSAFDAR